MPSEWSLEEIGFSKWGWWISQSTTHYVLCKGLGGWHDSNLGSKDKLKFRSSNIVPNMEHQISTRCTWCKKKWKLATSVPLQFKLKNAQRVLSPLIWKGFSSVEKEEMSALCSGEKKLTVMRLVDRQKMLKMLHDSKYCLRSVFLC